MKRDTQVKKSIRNIFIYVALFFCMLCMSGCSTFYGALASLGIYYQSNLKPPAPLVNFTPQLNIQRLWAVRATYGTEKLAIKLVPAVYKNKVYTAGLRGRVVAVNRLNGRRIWKVHLRDTHITAGPAASSGIVVVATGDGEVIALAASDGKEIWHARVADEVLAAPNIVADRVYIKTIDGRVYALARKDGHVLWMYNHGAPTSLTLRGSSVPQYSDGRIIAGFANGKIDILNATTGSFYGEATIAVPRGTTQIQQLVDIDADPRVSRGVIYAATYQGNVAALYVADGKLVWKHRISSYSGIALGPQRLFVADAASHIWAFDRYTGGVDWRNTKLAHRNITGPAVMGNAIVVGDAKGYLHWLSSSDGRFLGRVYVNSSGIVAAPVVVGNVLYVVSKNGSLAAYKVTLKNAG